MIEISLFVISLLIGVIGLIIAYLGFKKDRASNNPQAASKLGIKILVLSMIVGALNTIVIPSINYFKPKQPLATKADFERLVAIFTEESGRQYLNDEVVKKSENEPIGILTGSRLGTYIKFGHDIAKIAKKEGLNIVVKESAGTIDNVRRLVSKENAALSFVQSDTLGFLGRSTKPEWEHIANNLRIAFPLYKEEVHLFANKSVGRFEDLQNKRVVVGIKDSGNWITSNNLFQLSGVTASELIELSPAEEVSAVLLGNADAMIYVAGQPAWIFLKVEKLKNNPEYKNLLDNVHFVPLDNTNMLKEYSPGELSPSYYTSLVNTVPTITVKAFLISFDFSKNASGLARIRCYQLWRLGNIIRKYIEELRQVGHPKWLDVDLSQDVGIWKRDTCIWGSAIK